MKAIRERFNTYPRQIIFSFMLVCILLMVASIWASSALRTVAATPSKDSGSQDSGLKWVAEQEMGANLSADDVGQTEGPDMDSLDLEAPHGADTQEVDPGNPPPSTVQPTTEDKLVAITFDDGPGKYTNRLLDALQERGVKATFFVLGSCAVNYPDAIERIVGEGHELASHSYGHPNMSRMSKQDILNELNWTKSTVYEASGGVPTLFRPPGGNIGDNMRAVCAEEDLPIILWSVDTEDWKSRNVDTILSVMFDNGALSVQDGDIILMHDIYETTVDAAILAIDRMLEEGYTFVTVSELLELRCGGGEPGQTYRQARP